MSVALIRELYDYHHWANRRLFGVAMDLGEGITRDMGQHWSSPTLKGMFAHICGADDAWLKRWKGASPSSLGGAGQVTSTILPANLPFQSAKSLSFAMGATMMGALKTPLVAGVHARGMARSSKTRGAVMRTCEDSIHQPRPKSKASVLTSFKPQLLNFSCVHRSALRIAGELVMRPPISSAR